MANSLLDLVQSQFSGAIIDQLSQNIGADREKTQVATNGILSTLVGALTNNAKSQDGISSLFNALQQDHDGSILDNVSDYLNPQLPNPVPERTANGAGILSHLLGDKQGNIIQMISQLAGIDSSSAGGLMKTIAPILMGILGRQTRQNNMDSSGLMDLFNNERQQITQQREEMSPIMRMLDMDGDGSVIDDVGGLLAKFLRK